MNKERRKQIADIIATLNDLKDDLQTLLDEETDYKENIPENLQMSERYEKADEACSALDDALSNIDDAIDNLQTAQE